MVYVCDSAFSGCAWLTEIEIPASVMQIDGLSLRDCTSLQQITVNPDNESYCSIDGVLFSKSAESLYVYPDGKTGAYRVPDDTTYLGNSSFAGCSGLTAVTFPDSLTEIDAWAFEGCTGLTAVTIPEHVGGVYYDVFAGCSALRTVAVLNPECWLNDGSETLFADPYTVTVYGYAGSTAQQYAQRYGYAFRYDGCEYGIHDYVFESDTATCLLPGVVTSRCTLCGAQKQETSEAPGHSMELGRCTRCGWRRRWG